MMSPLADVADIVAKATIVAGIAIAAGWLARRQRAAVRHLIFAAAFVVLALLPAARVMGPSIPVRLPLARTAWTPPALPPAAGELTFAGRSSSSGQATRDPGWPATATSTLLQATWLVGGIACLLTVALGLWQIRRVQRDAVPWRGAQITETIWRAGREAESSTSWCTKLSPVR